MRIILVEDESRARQGLAQLICNLPGNHRVVAQASDGQKGFDSIQKLKPDLVFTDVKMEPVSGIDMIAMLRRAGNPVKVAIISAYEEFEYARAALEYGVIGYVTKPITVDEIAKCISKAETDAGTAQEPGADEAADLYIHPCVQKALKIIETEYTSHLGQVMLARRLHLTPQYFSYLFKRDTGTNFTDYLKRHRVCVAQRL